MIAGGEALELLRAYQSLQLSIQGPPMPTLQGYNLLQARSSLLDPSHRTAPVILDIRPTLQLEPTNNDYLQFAGINSGYDQRIFDEDGVCLMRCKRLLLQASAGGENETTALGGVELSPSSLITALPLVADESVSGAPMLPCPPWPLLPFLPSQPHLPPAGTGLAPSLACPDPFTV